jgi:hypothetical protein
MKKMSFVLAILVSAALAGCHSKKPATTGAGSGSGDMSGSAGSAAGSGDMGSAAGSGGGSAM